MQEVKIKLVNKFRLKLSKNNFVKHKGFFRTGLDFKTQKA